MNLRPEHPKQISPNLFILWLDGVPVYFYEPSQYGNWSYTSQIIAHNYPKLSRKRRRLVNRWRQDAGRFGGRPSQVFLTEAA